MYSVDVTKQDLSWRRVTAAKGTAPSPRNSHSCWVHRDRWVVLWTHTGNNVLPGGSGLISPVSCRLIYFGGYGCKTMGDMQNTSATNFIVEELSWVIGNRS